MGISIFPAVIALACNSIGGWTPAHFLSAASTNLTSVKTSPGSIGYIVVINTTGTIYYFKLFDTAANPPVIGTSTLVHTFPIPANTNAAGVPLAVPAGINFVNGIGFGLTGGEADSDTSNAATGVVINIGYA